MTIVQLKYVLAVAQHRNFTRAAQSVFVTQPTLSMQIQKLEEELDVQIFDRSQKPIGLTETGEKLVEQARSIVDESERMQDIIDQAKGFIGGDFTVGIIPTVMPTLLPMFLKTFIDRYPRVRLHIKELTTQAILEGLEKGTLDAAIAATPLNNDRVKEWVLYYEPFVAYLPQGHKLLSEQEVTPTALDDERMLLLQDGHCFKNSVMQICRNAAAVFDDQSFQLLSGSFETLVKLVDEGQGITLLPYLNTLDLNEKQHGQVLHFTDPKPAREVSLIHSTTGLKMQIIEALRDSIAAVVRGAIAFQNVEIISPRAK